MLQSSMLSIKVNTNSLKNVIDYTTHKQIIPMAGFFFLVVCIKEPNRVEELHC